MSEKSPTLAKIEETIEAIGKDKCRPWYCSAPETFGPVTFRDLLNGVEFPQGEGVYVIWGEDGERPLYVGMTRKGQQRPLAHLRVRPYHSLIKEILEGSKGAYLNWAIFFCPLLGDFDRRVPWLPCALISFERKVAKSLNPWFWHGGLRGDPLECPYIEA